jgi:cobalt-zinc-cadmium efflux system outer membrane protein
MLRLRAAARAGAVLATTTTLLASLVQAAPAPARARPATTRSDAPPPLLTPAPPASPAKDVVPPTDPGVLRGAQSLPLDAIVRHAKDNAMRVRVSRARLQLGEAAVEGAKPLLPDNPQLYVGIGRRWNNFGHNFELQSTLTQPIEIGGERGLRIKSGRRYRDYLDKELAQTQWEVYANVHYAYNMALLARERAVTAERTLEFSTRLLEVAQRRAQAGEISSLRVRIATGELAQARQAKLSADLEYRLACIHLSEMAGWPPGQLVTPAGGLPAPIHASTATDLIARVQQEHPALRAREAAVHLGNARVSSAERDRLPEPQIGVYFGREYEPGAMTGASKIALFMFTLPLPLWKRNQANRAQSKAELSVAEQELEATRYGLALSALRAVDALNTAAERVRTYSSEVVPRFQENLDLLQRAFELGEVDILEVFVARENFMRIQAEALDAYRSYFDAEYTLETILGSPLQAIATG